MKIGTWIAAWAALGLVVCVACGDPRTQEPSQDEIRAAVEKRRKAIDDDPNLSPEVKEMLKSRITGGGVGQPQPDQKR
ncbi:MAG: hypothetical protein LDL56_09165 [Armatimonadetes bacterium]|jgi:hypothetical protein|nr:hypothetical protein [Armatimonadota bacterium]MCA1997383.1 hypothetical protein [Armatimonadota bacterium]